MVSVNLFIYVLFNGVVSNVRACSFKTFVKFILKAWPDFLVSLADRMIIQRVRNRFSACFSICTEDVTALQRTLNIIFLTGLFWRIHMIDLYSSVVSFIAMTLASTYLVALAYKNTKFVLKHKVSSDTRSVHYQ